MIEFLFAAISVVGINMLIMQAFILIMCCFQGFREQFDVPDNFWTMEYWTRPMKLEPEYYWDTTTNSGTTILMVRIDQQSKP